MEIEKQLIKMFKSEDDETWELAKAIYEGIKYPSEILTKNYLKERDRRFYTWNIFTSYGIVIKDPCRHANLYPLKDPY